MQLRLKKRTKKGKESIYVYDFNGCGVTIESTPIEWTWKVSFECIMPFSTTQVVDAFVKAGISQHDFAGGFNEAVSVLTID